MWARPESEQSCRSGDQIVWRRCFSPPVAKTEEAGTWPSCSSRILSRSESGYAPAPSSVASPAPRDIWRGVLRDDPGATALQTPEYFDAVVSATGGTDVSRSTSSATGASSSAPGAPAVPERPAARCGIRRRLRSRRHAGHGRTAGRRRTDGGPGNARRVGEAADRWRPPHQRAVVGRAAARGDRGAALRRGDRAGPGLRRRPRGLPDGPVRTRDPAEAASRGPAGVEVEKGTGSRLIPVFYDIYRACLERVVPRLGPVVRPRPASAAVRDVRHRWRRCRRSLPRVHRLVPGRPIAASSSWCTASTPPCGADTASVSSRHP